MSCPICDHTMQSVGPDEGMRRFWCPRCGTIKNTNGEGFELFEVPRLIRLMLETKYPEAIRESMQIQQIHPDDLKAGT